MLDRPKTEESEVVLQAMVANLAYSTERIKQGQHHYLHEFNKCIWRCKIVPLIIKLLQNK